MNKVFTDAMNEYNAAVYNEKDVKRIYKIARCGITGVVTTATLGFIGVPPQISAKIGTAIITYLGTKNLLFKGKETK